MPGPAVGGSRRAPGKLDLELRHWAPQRRDAGKNVTRHQPRGEIVRVLKNDCIVDLQAERPGGRDGRGHGALDFGGLQRMLTPRSIGPGD